MIRLITIPSVFTAEGREIREVEHAPTVGHLLEREEGGGDWHTIVHGAKVELDHELSDGDELIAVRRPQGFLIPFLIFAVINALIGIGIALLINLLLGPKGQVNRGAGPDGSATYNWTGIANTRTNGSPIPIAYGLHRVGGQIIGLFRRNVAAQDRDMDLYLNICLGYGPLTAIGNYTEDMDNLVPNGSMLDDGSRAAGPDILLEVDDRWTKFLGGTAQIEANESSNDRFLAQNLGTEAAWRASNTMGVFDQNIAMEMKIVSQPSPGNGMRFCICMLDETEYFAFYITTGGTAQFIKRKASSDTSLFSFSIANNDVIQIARYGDCIEGYKNGVLQNSADADVALTADDAGIHADITGGIEIFDDVAVLGARGLPDGTLINGVDANTYNFIRGHIRLGNYKQRQVVDSNFTKVIQAYQPAIVLRTSWTEYKFHRDVGDFQIVLDFLNGLFDQSGGGLANATVRVEVELSEDGGAFAAITGSPFDFTEKITSPFSMTIFGPASLVGSNQKLRIRRTTTPGTEADTRVQDKVSFADVNEIQRDDRQTYDGFAVLSLRMRATDQLQGGTPNVTSLIKGLPCPTWDGGSTSEPEVTYAFSQNPADVALDMLLSKERGLGNFIDIRDIDVASFDSWRTHNNEIVTYAEWEDEPLFTADSTDQILAGQRIITINDATEASNFAAQDYCRIEDEALNIIIEAVDLGGGGKRLTVFVASVLSYGAGWRLHKVEAPGGCDPLLTISDTRHTFNGVFDGTASVWDSLLRVARAGRAMIVKLGNKISVRVEKIGVPVQHINEASMVEGTLEITYIGAAERVDKMEAQYLNAADDYDQAVATAGGFPPASAAKATIIGALQLYGITKSSEARREAFYHLNAQRLLQKRARFAMPLDGLAAEQGDIVSLGLTLTDWSHWTGRVTGTKAKFVISHEVILATGVSYLAVIRSPDDRAPTAVNVTSVAGTYAPGDEITTDATDIQQIKDSVCTIGTANTIDREYRVVQMRLKNDLTVEVEAVQYNPDVYALVEPPPCFCPLPDPSGAPPGPNIDNDCIYNIPLPELCDCDTGCEETIDCRCCTSVAVSAVCTGAGCSCVSIDDVGDGGVIIDVPAGCTGAFCIEITIDKTDILVCDDTCECEDAPCNKLLPIFECSTTCTLCYTAV